MKRRAERIFTSKLYKNYVFTRNLILKYEKRIQSIVRRSFFYRTSFPDSILDGLHMGGVISVTFRISNIPDSSVQIW